MADIVPDHATAHGATVLTFPADVVPFASRLAAERYLKDRGFSVGHWQEGAPAGVLHGAGLDIRKWRDLSSADQDALDGRMSGDGRLGPITVMIDAKASHAAHIDAVLPQPSRRPASSERSIALAFAGLFACIGVLGALLFLPRPASVVHRHAAVEQLFLAPKIGLRAEALRRLPPETEAASR